MIKIVFGKAVDGDNVYRPPSVCSLSEEQESELVLKGNAIYVLDEAKKVKKNVEPDTKGS